MSFKKTTIRTGYQLTCLTVLLLGLQGKSLASIHLGLSRIGSNQLALTYTPLIDYNANGSNIWNSQVFTLRWNAALGSNVIMGISNQSNFNFALDGNVVIGPDGFYYQKFAASATGVLQTLSAGQAKEVLRITTSLANINLSDFSLAAATLPWVSQNFGAANIENAKLGEQFFLFSPAEPSTTSPVCAAPSAGVIQVKVYDAGSLEYSIDNGQTWQSSPVFSNLQAGNYYLKTRRPGSQNPIASYSGNPVVLSLSQYPVAGPVTITQPTCAAPTGKILVQGSGQGAIQYSVNNGLQWQSGNLFQNLVPGSYKAKVRLVADTTCITSHPGNPLQVNNSPGYPSIGSLTITQPASCENPYGSITFNMTSLTGLQFSLLQGADWQSSNIFNSVYPDAYHVLVRRQADTTCLTSYPLNPAVVQIPPGCCLAPRYAFPCSSGDYIDNFSFGFFSNNNTGCPSAGVNNLSEYPNMGPDVQLGESYQVTAKAGPAFPQYFGLYIDFNQNGSYLDAGEFFNLGFAPAGGTVTATIAVPMGAKTGTSTLRLRSNRYYALTASDGCYTKLHVGETEDYRIRLFCPNQLAVNGLPIVSGTYSADVKISSTGKILSGSNVVFKAGALTELLPGFEVATGGILHVSSESCF
ncbi:MAG: hypothetical protein RI973_264 [Bacteroidota bacterium]